MTQMNSQGPWAPFEGQGYYYSGQRSAESERKPAADLSALILKRNPPSFLHWFHLMLGVYQSGSPNGLSVLPLRCVVFYHLYGSKYPAYTTAADAPLLQDYTVCYTQNGALLHLSRK